MSFKVLFRTVVFLLILFVVLYAGVNNTESISFSFPPYKAIRASAAWIFFGIFAVGVLGGTLLHAGGGRKGGGKDK